MSIFKSESIRLLARTHGYFPAAFQWRGCRFDVAAVEKCWNQRGPDARRLFRVRCDAGSFVLEQSVASDRWRITRWPLAFFLPRPPRTRSPRFPLPRSQRRPEYAARSHRPLVASAAARPAQLPSPRSQPWTPAAQHR